MKTQNDVCIRLKMRSQVLAEDEGGHALWQVDEVEGEWNPAKTAVVVCDMWDSHWSRGATERVNTMVPAMDRMIRSARSLGMTIIHAPSETMDFYEGTPARNRVMKAPHADMPEKIGHADPVLPIDDSDGGSDTGESLSHKAWSRQHPGLSIDQKLDAISDSGQEIFNFLRMKGIDSLLIMGVHTNMCILARPFAIRVMVGLGFRVALVRDLTDSLYNPARAPYVSHEEGTGLVVGYIEKFWCPSVMGRDLQ